MIKPISHLLILCGLLAALTACQEIGKGGRIAEREAKKSIEDTKDALERVFTYYPEHEEYRPIPYAFCYRVMQDITCYDHPVPEARARLVGWQGRDSAFISNKAKLPADQAAVAQAGGNKEIKDGVATNAAVKVIEASNEKKKVEKEKEKEIKQEEKKLEPVFTQNPETVKEQKIKIKVTESDSAAMY